MDELQMDKKLRLYIALLFLPIFAPFWKIEKVAENGRIKAIPFSSIF
jgi:hypothetical protein